MRGILTCWAFAVILVFPAAAQIDDSRVSAAIRAADEFLRRAEGSASSGNMPRRTDPEIAGLLDTVFDQSALGSEPLPIAKIGSIGELARNGNRIGLAYILAGTGRTDAAGADQKTLERIDRNTATFAPEVGQFADFQLLTTNRMARSGLGFVKSAPKETLEQDRIKAGLGQMRAGLAQTIGGMLKTFTLGDLDRDWKARRLAVLEGVADTAAHFLDGAQKTTLRQLADQVAPTLGPELEPRLKAFGERVAAPAP